MVGRSAAVSVALIESWDFRGERWRSLPLLTVNRLVHRSEIPQRIIVNLLFISSRYPATGVKKCLDEVAHSQDTPLNTLWYDVTTRPLCSRAPWTFSF